ncbi:MAG: Antitoxin Phd YefM, type toxin-antitoxin system [Candidatus Parcubacteria bacterium]
MTFCIDVRYYVHIMNTRIVSTTEARKNIFTFTEDIQSGGVHYLLTEKGRAKAVLISAEEYESWKETLALFSEVPDVLSRVARAERDIELGRTVLLSELKEKYALPSTSHKRIGKKSR